MRTCLETVLCNGDTYHLKENTQYWYVVLNVNGFFFMKNMREGRTILIFNGTLRSQHLESSNSAPKIVSTGIIMVSGKIFFKPIALLLLLHPLTL
ncbi:MAG: hypothetical protein Ct9H90mP20_7260 [Candidatus Neomarinimicrobiota bacterium]|nr:MAG: hypothetical protein Ct9H90mP20_7260 [Candidatus Neomarinimicrobiota bacterium]